MNIFDNYYVYNFNSIILSKIVVKSLSVIPRVQKLSFIVIVNLKQYKKNLLLFYIVISIMFGGVFFLQRKVISGLQVFNIIISKKKINKFLLVFIGFYLPWNPDLLFVSIKNTIIKSPVIFFNNKKICFIYSLNYLRFPIVSELELLYFESDFVIYYFISYYRFQIDIYINKNFIIKDSGEFLLRLYRLPCRLYLNY